MSNTTVLNKLTSLQTYWFTQAVSWLTAYAIMSFLVSQRSIVVATEFAYGFVLLFISFLMSHSIRWLYKKKIANLNLGWQSLYFVVASIIGSSFATGCLFVFVIALSFTDFAFPIPESQYAFVANHVFSGNMLNMLALLLLWCSLYFGITRVRLLTNTKKALVETQLEVLQNQLNPHFLFNSLNNIRALILEDPSKSRDMLSSLSELLRYSLRAGDRNSPSFAKVTLSQELAFIQDYIALSKIQFEERLDYTETAASDCLNAAVPKMILQLLIENAIKHGIEQIRDGGNVILTVAKVSPSDFDRQAQQLEICVENSLPTEKAETPSFGIGLSNIRQRLALLYTEKADVTLDVSNDRAKVTVTFPFEVIE